VRLTWPLTGRLEEMRLIEAALSAPDLSGIIICGPAGVGKSRVSREALAYADSRGCEVRWAVGTSAARELPLGAFAQWARSEEMDALQLVRGVIGSLTSTPRDTPVVVGVDDVHLLDDLSIFVLHQIVQRAAAKLILTVRSGEPVPPATQELWKGSQFERLDLQPLSQAETALLVSATLGGSLNPDVAQRLWKLTRGNVLYLRNIVEQEVADGRLAEKRGCWMWSGDPVVPPSLVEMIESRIGTLPAAVSYVIDALAVGEPIGLAALNRITDPAAVEEAEMLGLITLVPGEGGVEARVAHPLYAEVRRKRAPSTRLRRLRGLVAAELAASDRRDDTRIVVQRAALSLDSDLTPEPELLVRAAQGAVWLADLPLADRLADAAIRVGAGAEAHFVRAHALSWLSRGQEADTTLAEIPTSEFTEADHARVAFLRAANMIWTLADPDGSKRLIDAASRVAPPRSCIDAFLTVYWAAMGKPEAAEKSSRELALDELPHVIAAVTAWALAVASGDAGRTAEAASAADAGYDIVIRGFDAAHMRFVIADGHIGALLLSGRMDAAGDTAERMRQQAADLPGSAQLFGAALTGCAALGAGKLDSACSLLGPVVEALSASGETNGWAYRYQLPYTVAVAMRGSTTEATAALGALEQMRHKSWRFLDYELDLARAWVAGAQGALTEAVRLALSAAETAGANGQFAAEVMCLQTAAQLGDGSSVSRLRELERIVEGPRVGFAARLAAALHDRDAAELTTVSAEFERMGDLVAALDAAAHAAIAYRSKALRGSALGSSAAAEALAQRCGGAVTPALRQATEQLPLSSREREIVMLIGEGMSNRAIAARLTLSVRTVEGHIYRAMAKTEVSARDELGALLPRRRS
jgi:DNA-binding CsgD family transcriptional regulator